MFRPHQRGQIIISNIGIMLWLGAIGVAINKFGFLEVFRTYLVPYLWYVAFTASHTLGSDVGTPG